MASKDTKYDDILWTITKQSGGVAEFLGVIASFLNRRTDFFSGASKEQWETLLLKKFHQEHKNPLNANPSNKEPSISESESESESGSETDSQKLIQTVSKKEAIKESTTPPPSYEELSKPITTAADESETEEIGKLTPNDGNGCTLSSYSWTQSLREIDLKVPLNVIQPLRSHDVNVRIMRKSLTVGVKGQKPIIDGELSKEIKPDESTWMLQDGKTISITLEKRKRESWWERLIISDPEIAIKKISPEPSKLSDLDDGTRATVEKMLYDQRRKEMGLPTSDDQKNLKLIEEFKNSHPELDFSKCKF